MSDRAGEMVPVDATQLNGLLVARGLLDRAVLSRDGTAPGEITALVLLDLAVESGAKALLGTKVEKGANFRQTMERLDEEHRAATNTTEPLAGLGRVRELRDLRNGVQHAGNTPAPQDVARYHTYAEDFLDAASQSLLGVALRDLSSASLLHHEDTRSAVLRAEQGAAEGDMEDAARNLAIAFAHVVERFRATQPWRRRGRLSHHEVRRAAEALAPKKSRSALTSKLRDALRAIPTKRPMSTPDARDIADAALASGVGDTRPLVKVLQDLTTELGFLTELTEAATVVGDAGEHAWFHARVGKATPLVGSPEYSYFAPEPEVDGREFRRAMAFVLNAALRQQLLEESPPPEGSLRGIQSRQQAEWEGLKDAIVELATNRENETVLIDDVVQVLEVSDPARVEPAITELLEEGRLEQIAPEAFKLP